MCAGASVLLECHCPPLLPAACCAPPVPRWPAPPAHLRAAGLDGVGKVAPLHALAAGRAACEERAAQAKQRLARDAPRGLQARMRKSGGRCEPGAAGRQRSRLGDAVQPKNQGGKRAAQACMHRWRQIWQASSRPPLWMCPPEWAGWARQARGRSGRGRRQKAAATACSGRGDGVAQQEDEDTQQGRRWPGP